MHSRSPSHFVILTLSRTQQLYAQVVNLKYYLTRGESAIIIGQKNRFVEEPLDATAATHLKKELSIIVTTRKMVTYALAQHSYLDKVLCLVKDYKKTNAITEGGENFISSNDPRGPAWDAARMQFRGEFKRVKRNCDHVSELMFKSVHPLCCDIMRCWNMATSAYAYWELGNQVCIPLPK